MHNCRLLEPCACTYIKVLRLQQGFSNNRQLAFAGMFALRERRIHVTQEDFEMAVSKVMKKDSEQDISIKKLWK